MAAELATNKAEFNALQEQAQNKEETIKMEAALPRRKVELERMEVRKRSKEANGGGKKQGWWYIKKLKKQTEMSG